MSVSTLAHGLEERVHAPAPDPTPPASKPIPPSLRWFGRAPRAVAAAGRRGQLTPGAIRAVAALVLLNAVHHDPQRWCSWDRLADAMGASEETARRSADLLELHALAEVERTDSGRYRRRIRLNLDGGWFPVPLMDPEHQTVDHQAIRAIWALAYSQADTLNTAADPLTQWQTLTALDVGTIAQIADAMGASTAKAKRAIRAAHTAGYLDSITDPAGGASLRRIRWEIGATTIGHRLSPAELHLRSRQTPAEILAALPTTEPRQQPRKGVTGKRRSKPTPPTVLSIQRSKLPPEPPTKSKQPARRVAMGEVIEASKAWAPLRPRIPLDQTSQRAAAAIAAVYARGWTTEQIAAALDTDALRHPLPPTIDAPAGLLARRVADATEGPPPVSPPPVPVFVAPTPPSPEDKKLDRAASVVGLSAARQALQKVDQ